MTEVTDEDLQEALDKVPAEMLAKALERKGALNTEAVESAQHVSQHYSGPLPPPRMLEQYDAIDAGLANRIVQMAEREQSHRHETEKRAIGGVISKDKRGQNYALITSLALIFGSVFLIYSGKELSGSILAGTTLLGLAYMFITGRKSGHETEE